MTIFQLIDIPIDRRASGHWNRGHDTTTAQIEVQVMPLARDRGYSR
jgi:hypothetical protein